MSEAIVQAADHRSGPRSGSVRFVLSCQNGSHEDIELEDHGVPVIVGRGPATRIKDKRLSKNQVQLTVDYDNRVVQVLQLGPNPSEICGKPLVQNCTAELRCGSVLNLLCGKYPQVCKLISLEDASESPPTTRVTGALSNEAIVPPAKRTIDDYWHKGAKERDSSSVSNIRDAKKLKKEVRSDQELDASEACEARVDEEEEEQDKVDETSTRLEEMRRFLCRSNAPPPSGSGGTGMKRSTSLPLAQPSMSNGLSSASSSSLAMAASAGLGLMRKSASGLPKAPGDRWDYQNRLIMYTCKGSIPREKIAGFDVDWTIIGTKTGKVFPAGPDDWRLLYPEVLSKLRQLFEEDYKIVFFTNQRGLSKDSSAFNNFKNKIQNVISKIGVPVQVFISTGSGINRKPAPGMWNYLESVGNEGLSVDVHSSFFVGDAAGRPANSLPGKKKKDFSCADRLFALNIGLKFFTPEEFFLGQKPAPYLLPQFDPRTLKSDVSTLCSPPKSKLMSNEQELIILVGYPASGKSHFALQHLVPKGYVHINRDILGSWQKCVSATQSALKQGKSVVVDNTNGDAATRKRYIDCARLAGIVCRCFCMAVDLDHAKHNNKFRHMTNSDQNHEQVNDITLNTYRARYEEPKVMEGYREIVTINFVPSFNDEKLDKLYHMFLV